MKKSIFLIIILFLFSQNSNASDFSIEFEWGDLELCTTGKPNIVKNPEFILKNVPEGTTWIKFRMTDHNSPYNHGGGWAEYKGVDEIESGIFNYQSPCPPDGKHTYQWTAVAKSKKSDFGSKIGEAKATREYP